MLEIISIYIYSLNRYRDRSITMEIRKVQVTGGSSYIISLPKGWARSLKIQKNDPLGILIQPDGDLIVTPRISGEKAQRERIIEVTPNMDPTFLFRLLIATYIGGYTVIHLRARGKLSPFVRSVVRNFTQMTIGQEVSEETEGFITVKDLLNPVEMPFDRTLRRMAVIVRSMNDDALSAFLSGNAPLLADVIARDNDVDRLHWLIARQFNLILADPNLAREMKISLSTGANYYVLSRLIERIGDHGVRIAENAQKILEKRLEGSLKADFRSVMDQALDIFSEGVDAFFSKDLEASHRIIGSVAPLEKRCSEMEAIAQHHKGEIANILGAILGSIRRIGEYTEDICENTINHLVSEGMLEVRPASRHP
jgi:phosphate uptake regulator